MESLRKKTLRGVAWTFLEKLGTQLVHFVVTIVLARLLSPQDYGVIGMLVVFLSISQLFIDCGFGSAIIRKKDRSEADYSTVFWYNLAISIFCYCLLFVAAPIIADFYNMSILTNVLRVVGLNLIIHSLYAIQVTRLTALVQFGIQAKTAVVSAIVSGAIGICFAYLGGGVWALVAQSMSAAILSAISFWIFSGWRPRLCFSRRSFHQLFGFGSRLMLANSLHTIYTNISPLIIGRKFSAADLGFYSRGDSLAALPGGFFQSTLGRVIYPVLSSIQDDESRLKATYNKYLRLITSLVVPSMLLFASCAKPIIILLIGEKWLPCVSYFQLLAIAWICDPIILVNLNVLYVKGRSDIVLELEMFKKLIAIIIVVTAVQFGIIWLCLGRVLYAYIALGLNIYYCGPFLGMSFWSQVKEVLPIYACAGIASTLAYSVLHYGYSMSSHPQNPGVYNLVILTLSAGLGFLVYSLCACFLKFDVVLEVVAVTKSTFRKLRRA